MRNEPSKAALEVLKQSATLDEETQKLIAQAISAAIQEELGEITNRLTRRL